MNNDPSTDIDWLKKELEKLDKKVDRGFRDMQSSIQDIRNLYLDTFETKTEARQKKENLQKQIDEKAQSDDVESIQKNITWIVRIIIGAVVVSLLALAGLSI